MYCNALNVLKERGFVEWSSHNEELEEHFMKSMVTGYIGFDPSADSLHVGNLVAIMGLAWMQRWQIGAVHAGDAEEGECRGHGVGGELATAGASAGAGLALQLAQFYRHVG